MCQIKIINLINIFLFLKYDDIKLKYNYSIYYRNPHLLTKFKFKL